MSSNKKSDNLDGAEDQAPADENDSLTEPAEIADEAHIQLKDEVNSDELSSTGGVNQDETSGELSQYDLLEDVRRSLIEEEVNESQKQSKWWQRIGKSGSKDEPKAEELKSVETVSVPEMGESDSELDVLKEELESEEYLEQIDELIDLLDAEDSIDAPVKQVDEVPAEPERPINLEELKKQAFQPRVNEGASETLSEVRNIAFEGDEEVFVEVESTPQDPLDERLKSVENALKPYRRYINFTVAFLGVIMALIAITIMYNVYQQSRPQPTPQVVSNLPYPSSVSLPGGWTFRLSKGKLIDGQWKPQMAEWLEGTEVSRWISLPWNRQLEAVLRTLNPEDPIELVMSNNDRLVYKVYSIRQMSSEEMQELDTNTPSLLIILSQNDVEKHWVLTALP